MSLAEGELIESWAALHYTQTGGKHRFFFLNGSNEPRRRKLILKQWWRETVITECECTVTWRYVDWTERHQMEFLLILIPLIYTLVFPARPLWMPLSLPHPPSLFLFVALSFHLLCLIDLIPRPPPNTRAGWAALRAYDAVKCQAPSGGRD